MNHRIGEPALTTPLPVRTLIEPSRECEETVSWLCIRKTRRRAAPSPSLGRGASHPTEQYHQKDAHKESSTKDAFTHQDSILCLIKTNKPAKSSSERTM